MYSSSKGYCVALKDMVYSSDIRRVQYHDIWQEVLLFHWFENAKRTVEDIVNKIIYIKYSVLLYSLYIF